MLAHHVLAIAVVTASCHQPNPSAPAPPTHAAPSRDAAVARQDAPTPAPPPATPAPPPPPLSVFTQPALGRHRSDCTPASCSGHGHCVEEVEIAFPLMTSRCDCAAGYYALGLTCVACRPAGDPFEITVKTARLHGRIALGGKPLPADFPGLVELVPVGAKRGIELPRSGFDIKVIHGTYDVIYRGSTKEDERTAIVIARGLPVRGDVHRDLELGLMPITGKVAFPGAPAGRAFSGAIELVRGNDRIALPIEHGKLAGYAPAGAYDLLWRPAADDDMPPALVRRGVAVRARLDLDIPVVEVTGAILGLDAPPLAEHGVWLGFWNHGAEPGEWPPGGRHKLARDGAYTQVLVRGRYDVILQTQFDDLGATLRIAKQVDVKPGRLDLHAPPFARLGGRFLIDSAPVRHTIVRHGPLVLAIGEDDLFGFVKLEIDRDGTYSGLLPHGRYMLAFAREAETGVDDVLPIERVTIAGDTQWTYNLPLVDTQARVTLDGQPPPRDFSIDLTAPITRTRFSGRIPPGTYAIHTPLGHPAGSVQASPGMSPLAIDVPTRVLTGTLTARDVPASAAIVLRSSDEAIRAGELAAGTYQVRLVPGSYGVYYHAQSTTAPLVQNRSAFLGCVHVK